MVPGEGARWLIGSPLPLPLLLSLPPLHSCSPDFKMDMPVTLEDLYNGQQRTINVKRKVICKAYVEKQDGCKHDAGSQACARVLAAFDCCSGL